METKANYVLIGAFTLVTAVFLLLFGLWAAKFSSDRDWREYLVIFTEPVTGLTEGSSVQYNGIAVGTVERLELDREVYTPVGMQGWGHVVFRRDRDRSRHVMSLDYLLDHLEDWGTRAR